MANELKHVSVGTSLTQDEYESVTGHAFESQATGDTMYASSATQLSRLGIGSAGQVLRIASGLPAWSTATFPGTGGASGTWLRSDGTNIVNSTTTLPDTAAVSTILYASAANVISALATASSGVLVTSGAGVPSISGVLPAVTLGGTVVSNGQSFYGTIASLGTVTTVTINGGTITGITDLAVADGGTGSSTAAAARTALGVVIGTDVQAYDAQLADVAGLAVTDNNFIVGNGSNFVAESGATARTSLGLGTFAVENIAAVPAITLAGTVTLNGQTLSGTAAGTPTFSDAVVFSGIPSLTGGALQFPAAQVASSGANVLDDYEEGTWTPTITSSGGGSAGAYGARNGSYLKVGQLVYITFDCEISAIGSLTSSSGQTRISSLPFSAMGGADNYPSASFNHYAGVTTAYYWISGGVNGTSIDVSALSAASTAQSSLPSSTLGASARLVGSAVYRATA